eukprot:1357380-Pyramimonas_sp.AAC.1
MVLAKILLNLWRPPPVSPGLGRTAAPSPSLLKTVDQRGIYVMAFLVEVYAVLEFDAWSSRSPG